MQFMLVARAHGYETNPIGGFEAEKLAETFGLDQERYVPVMILSVGKGMETGYESVRLAPEKSRHLNRHKMTCINQLS